MELVNRDQIRPIRLIRGAFDFQSPDFEITQLPDSAVDVLTLPFREFSGTKSPRPVTNFLDPCLLPAQQ